MLDLFGKYIQAFGLLTTLKPNMEIDPDDPMGMAEELCRYVREGQVSIPKGTLNLGLVEHFGTSGDEQRRLVVIARYHADLPDLSLIGAIKFHLESGDTYKYTGIRIHSVESQPLCGGRMAYTFRYTCADSIPKPLVLGPISHYELNGYGYKGHTGDWKLTCKKVGDWKLTVTKCSEVNEVSFVSPKGQFYNFVGVSMQCMVDREDSLELFFHGTKVKP